MKKELCVPCSIELGKTKEVTKVGYRREKITCAECKRRRFGGLYEVKNRKEQNVCKLN